ncbi:MAG: hypothetical protein Q7U40_06535, partial [Desulfatirhabdiaceae bacterium]|nr:hypothetical protein [Desulfatirhabdiaceae bacterium]
MNRVQKTVAQGMSFVIGSVNVANGVVQVLVEEKKYPKAEQQLAIAARGIPDGSRVLYDFLGKDQLAEAALSRAVTLEPDSMDYLLALARHYLKRENFKAAGKIADQMIARHPGDRKGMELKGFVQRRRN